MDHQTTGQFQQGGKATEGQETQRHKGPSHKRTIPPMMQLNPLIPRLVGAGWGCVQGIQGTQGTIHGSSERGASGCSGLGLLRLLQAQGDVGGLPAIMIGEFNKRGDWLSVV